MSIRSFRFALVLASMFGLGQPGAGQAVRGDDWPQWFGPKRDGVWRERGIVDRFADEGLPVRWRVPVGPGYAGPAVANGRVYLMDRIPQEGTTRPSNPFQRITQPGKERVLCLNQADGKLIWSFEYDCPYSVSYSAGPRSTPAVNDGRVYTLGAEGDFHCLNVETGKPVWSASLSGPLAGNGKTATWGFSSHPLVDGDKVYCLSADPNATVHAWDKTTGKPLWTALSSTEPGYSPPVIFDVSGKRQLIIFDPEGVNSLNPENGKTYWTVPFGPLKYGASIVTPRLYHDEALGDLLYVTTQYEGSLMLRLDKNGAGEPTASVLWKRVGKSNRNTQALQSLMATASLRDGHIYGIDIMGQLRCLDLKTGDRLWESTEATTYDAGPQTWSTAFLIPIGDTGTRYLIPNEHGDLILADLTPDGYKEVSHMHLLEPTNTDPHRPVVWSHPALADRCIFWRNDKELVCASLAAK